MSRDSNLRTGWQGVSLVAITYVYFLIFAQFAFLHRLSELGLADANLKAIMAAMALGGILVSLLAPRMRVWPSARARLRAAFGLCGLAAILTMLPLSVVIASVVAFLIGAGLGLLTVTLVTHLREMCGDRNQLFKVGLGTGIGYLLCNVPAIFTALPEKQSILAAGFCFVGILVVPHDRGLQLAESSIGRVRTPMPFLFVVAGFTALVWLDSAAFFIIQSTPALKAGTWQGSAHLWVNAFLHFSAALASAWLLQRRGFVFVMSAAVLALAGACLLLIDPAHALSASIFYPIGVSLYSVALVAYPSLLAPVASAAERARRAGWIYAIAGWMGSALGIGMGQNLGHVPLAFVALVSTVVLLPAALMMVRTRPRELGLTAAMLLTALIAYRASSSHAISASRSPIERGRQVYIAEGCISCHSQYVRPGTRDVLMWGPVASLELVHAERPPLIGNRRQGPDLSEVGVRRSPLWLKMHFFNPPEVSGSSIMPSYAFLFHEERGDFRGNRGDDLVAYLASLRGPGTEQHISDTLQWHLPAAAIARADAARGKQFYMRLCGTCHNADGATRSAWHANFTTEPTDLTTMEMRRVPASVSASERMDRIAQITKFGIPGTDMPGHEYLSDSDVASIATWLAQDSSHAIVTSKNQYTIGDRP